NRPIGGFPGVLKVFSGSAQVVAVCIETARRLSFRALPLSARNAWSYRTNYAGSHLILEIKDILQRSIISVRPKMGARSCINQLACYPYAIAGSSHAPFENITDPQISGHLLDVDRFALEGEGGVPRDDEELRIAGESRNDLFDDSIRKVLLLRISAHVL